MSAEQGMVCGSLSPSITLHMSTCSFSSYSSFFKAAKWILFAAFGGFGMSRIQATQSARLLPTNGERQAGFIGVFVPYVFL
jgi:hypothetical protein